MTTLAKPVMTRQEALRITKHIVEGADALWELLHKAYEGQAWVSLGYGSWREYAVAEFKVSQSQAYRLLDCAKVHDSFSPMGEKPTSERQMRPLAKLPPEQQREAWQKAVESSGKEQPTAREVAAAVEIIQPRPDPASGQVSVKDSDASDDDADDLWRLKTAWRNATKKSRAAFRKWLETE